LAVQFGAFFPEPVQAKSLEDSLRWIEYDAVECIFK